MWVMKRLFIFNTGWDHMWLGKIWKLSMRTSFMKQPLLSSETSGILLLKRRMTLMCTLPIWKKYWECLNLIDDERFWIAEVQFKIAIVSSLPSSWNSFTQPYISIRKDKSSDLKLRMTSQELIGVLKQEYVWHQRRTGKLQKDDVVNQTMAGKTSLLGRMDSNSQPCDTCGLHNQVSKDCKFNGQVKCSICTQFGHTSDECYSWKSESP